MKKNVSLHKLFRALSTLTLATAGIIFSDTQATADAQPTVAPSPPTPLRVNGTSPPDACKKGTDASAIIFSTKAMSNKDEWVLPDSQIHEIPFTGCDLNISLTKGETRSASFVIHAEKNLKNVKIVGVEFSSTPKANDYIAIDFKLVKAWYQAGGAGVDVGRSALTMAMGVKTLTPELLVNDLDLLRVDTKSEKNYLRIDDNGRDEYIDINSSKPITPSVGHFYPEYQVRDAGTLQPFAVNAGQNQQIWLTISASKNTLPGKYIGKIQLQSADGLNSSIDINVIVPNFELPESKLTYGIYYHGRLHPNRSPTVSSEYKTPEQLKLELRDIASHGIKVPAIYQNHNNKDLFLKYLQIMTDAGFSTKDLYLIYLNTNKAETSDQISNLKAQISQVKSITKPFSVNNIYVYGIDEAKGPRLTAQKPALQMIRGTGQKTYVAGAAGVFEATGDLFDILIFAEAPMKTEAEKYHSIGKKIFSYANPQSGVENPYLYRKNYGLMLWAADFDGAMLYAYQHCMGECWNDFDGPVYRDHNFTYPTSNGFVITTGWEGVREAINDVRYVNLLENRIKIVKESNLTSKTAIANQAEAYLSNIRNTLNKTNHYGQRSQPLNINLDDIRNNVVRYIELLAP